MEDSRDSTSQTDYVGSHVTEQGRVGESDEDPTGMDDEYDNNYDLPQEYKPYLSDEALPESVTKRVEAILTIIKSWEGIDIEGWTACHDPRVPDHGGNQCGIGAHWVSTNRLARLAVEALENEGRI